MSGNFSDVNAEPKPGTALRIMMEEHRYLDEFMAMIKAKLELDEKHVSELRALRDLWNSNWVGSGIGPLVSPLLVLLNNEITERENAIVELKARFAALPETPPPNSLDEDGLDPLEALQAVETRYHEYEKAHSAIVTPESINENEKWQNQVTHVDLFDIDPHVLLFDRWVLPVSERTYRKAVVAQQETVERAIKWTADNLTSVLERHQERTEDVKSFLKLLLNSYGDIHMGLSTSCSAAVEHNRAFSSSRFIAPRHDEREKEASHSFLQTVQYRNYMLGGQVARPMFGLGVERTVGFLNQPPIGGPYDVGLGTVYQVLSLLSKPNWTTRAFELEVEAVTEELPALLDSQTTPERDATLVCALFMDPPLLPLVGYNVARYPNGVPRRILSSLLDIHLPQPRTEVLTLLLRLVDNGKRIFGEFVSYDGASIQICHDAGGHAGRLVESIWRKWDIENDRPFPGEVERVWRVFSQRSEVVWKKSGIPYYISTQESSI